MLTAAKNSLTIFDEILQEKTHVEKYLKGECYSEHYQEYSYKYFFKIILNSKVIIKSIKDPDDNCDKKCGALMG